MMYEKLITSTMVEEVALDVLSRTIMRDKVWTELAKYAFGTPADVADIADVKSGKCTICVEENVYNCMLSEYMRESSERVARDYFSSWIDKDAEFEESAFFLTFVDELIDAVMENEQFRNNVDALTVSYVK